MAKHLLGSAAFSEKEGYTRESILDGKHIFFGRSQKNPDLFHGCKVHKHFVTVAPNRSGKGAALIVPNLLFYGGSAIVIDPKGENAFLTAQRRRELGQKVHILDPWGEVNRRYGVLSGELEGVASFDPLSILDPLSPHFADDVAYIADSLVINQGKDPHFDDSARELVAGLIAYEVQTRGQDANLPMVRTLLAKPVEEIAGIAEEAHAFGPDSLAARKLSRFKTASKEMASIISTAQTQTAFLDSETLSENMLESSFSFDDLTEGKATVFLVLPVDKLQTYGRWLRLLVSIGIRTIARNTRPLEAPVLFLLDEFGTIGKLSAVSQAVGLMAGLQMCVWVFLQDLNQLKRDYRDEWETFIANAAAVTFFNVMDEFSATYLSKMLGGATAEYLSGIEKRTREEIDGSARVQHFARPLRTPDELRRMPQELGIVLLNDNPIIFEKRPYFDDLEFCAFARQNPLFPDPIEVLRQRELAAFEKKEREEREAAEVVRIEREKKEKEEREARAAAKRSTVFLVLSWLVSLAICAAGVFFYTKGNNLSGPELLSALFVALPAALFLVAAFGGLCGLIDKIFYKGRIFNI